MRATPFSDEELHRIIYPFEGKRVIKDQFGNEGDDLIVALAQEIEYMRTWMAYHARVVEAQTMDIKGIAKKRRSILRNVILQLRTLALGGQLGWPQPGQHMNSEIESLKRKGEPYASDYVGDLD